jgi:predicted nucleotidyltransferase
VSSPGRKNEVGSFRFKAVRSILADTPVLMPVIDEHIEAAKAIARQYGATRMVVFGSAVNDPEHAHDLDLAIEGVEGWTIWELAGKIERALDIPVDVIPLDPNPFTELVEEYGREIKLRQPEKVEEAG